MPLNYYNEIDPFAAQWLRNLIDAELIPYGVVDTRSIRDVQPSDLAGFTQCHFFAGIGGWSYALSLAGVPASVPLWTGSCPCQPFSDAGKREGFDDPRHLWPDWFRLIRQCKPSVIFGEQVEAAIRIGWIDAVFSDLEAEGYACGTAVLPACSVGAPHIRQRLWFVANSECERRGARWASGADGRPTLEPDRHGATCSTLASGLSPRLEERQEQSARQECKAVERSDDADELADSNSGEPYWGARNSVSQSTQYGETGRSDLSSWSDLEWLPCIDGKWRPTQPGLFPLVDGLSKGMVRSGDPSAPFDADACAEARIGRLKGYGNAIVPQVAAKFIRNYLLTVRL